MRWRWKQKWSRWKTEWKRKMKMKSCQGYNHKAEETANP